ncbi:hypothetical protein VNO77_15995 [Canavalia gladiata]|uniref:Uncharacterized protein n=1 Tax=Canavalia gladiata TaxID=3824 RepID=A0AAN9M062_CANGL
MKMAQKHLRELLKEDQEPFLLKNYISERQKQLKRPSPNTVLQTKNQNPKPIHQINLCFLSFQSTTQDIRKSPLLELASPGKSPLRSSNSIFLHIPAKTATLLLEAALRIHKHSNTTKSRNKKKNDNVLGLLRSFLKRVTKRKKEIEDEKVSVKDILRWDSSLGRCENEKEKEKGNDVCSGEVGFTCSCHGRPSSAVWSESNEDLETWSSGGHSYDDSVEEGIQFVEKQKQTGECDHRSFFRYILHPSPSAAARRTPLSPGRHKTELVIKATGYKLAGLTRYCAVSSRTELNSAYSDKESNGDDGVNKFQSEEVEEEDKEQCSPVSVLDPPFDDDDGHENDDEDDGFDLECSYANVQRTKQQLLDRLRRFEKLAELDPVELEKRMLDQDDKHETFIEEDDYEDDDSETSCEEKAMREIVFEILSQSSVHAPEDLKRLVYDLIMEEERELSSSEDRNMVIRRICKRLELWKEVECNTIDMMIEEDFSREDGMWKKNAEQRMELARELELPILCFLVEELSEELLC